MTKRTNPLSRIARFEGCRSGAMKRLTDATGQITRWHTDVQRQLAAKEYGGGSKVTYAYKTATTRLREVIDEKGQRS